MTTASLATARALRSPADSPWVVGPGFDAFFFLASSLVVFLPWIAAERYHVSSWYILAGVGVASNGPHLASTWTRVYMDRAALRENLLQFVGVPLLLFGLVASLVYYQGYASPVLRSILFYYACYHFAQQNWGLLRIYQRKQGEPSMAVVRLERAGIYLGTLWCMLHRLFTGPWELFGANVLHPTPPPWLVNGTGALLVCVAVAIVGVRVHRALRGEAWDLVRPVFIASCFLGFFVPFLLMRSDGTSAFAAAACWHGVQYVGIVYYFNRRRFASGAQPGTRAIAWLSQPGRAPLYAVALLGLAGLAYASFFAGAAATHMTVDDFGVLGWTSLTFAHYYLDGVIWKLRRPENARPLGLPPQSQGVPA